VIRHLLIVDDDASVRASLEDALTVDGLRVSGACDGVEALERMASEQVDLVLTDVRMPRVDGLELLRRIRARMPAVDVVLMTAYDDMPVVDAAVRDGARDFLVKPLDLGVLRALVERLLGERELPASPREPSEPSP
jgi:DNA-binding NtrC family response regulator